MTSRTITCNSNGNTAIEFALAFPIFILLLIGALELGVLFLSSAGLKHAVNTAARQATISPTPSDNYLKANATEAFFGVDRSQLQFETVRGTDMDNGDYIELKGSYRNLPITTLVLAPRVITERRKVWLQEAP